MRRALFIGAAALLVSAAAASGQTAPRAPEREQLVAQADRAQEGGGATQGQAQRASQPQPSQTKEPQSDTTRLSLDEDLVRRVQSVLRDKGLLDDDPDGIFGARTKAALIQYQRQSGLEPTGEINVQTIHFIDQKAVQRVPTRLEGRKAVSGQASEPRSTPSPTQGLRGPGTPTSTTGVNQNPTPGQTGTTGQPTAPSATGRASIGGGHPGRPAIPSIGAPGSLSGSTGGVGSGISGAISGTGGPAGTSGASGGSSSR